LNGKFLFRSMMAGLRVVTVMRISSVEVYHNVSGLRATAVARNPDDMVIGWVVYPPQGIFEYSSNALS
jgi:hypothetical protein